MRSSLKWLLLTTAVASGGLVLMDQKPPEIGPVRTTASLSERQGASNIDARSAVVNLVPVGAAHPGSALWPTSLSSLGIAEASRDPFEPATSSLPKPAAPASLTSMDFAPTKPSTQYRFAGRMRTPEGSEIIWLQSADGTISVKEGQELKDGFLVETITAYVIRLRHVPSAFAIDLNVPPPSEGGAAW